MILGVALGRPANTLVAVRSDARFHHPPPDGAAYRAVCVAADLDAVRQAPVAALRVAGPCPDTRRPRDGPGAGPAHGRAGHT
ncbi:hypothetical protein, partial [Nonomuraea sp. NPDC050310]|uniref:hypothetical protein n=1 Tax=Nonomuraea sp. NPDC050310 TaxID=3154935 RepID=UPI0033E716CD